MVREGRCMQREGAWTAVWAPISLATMAAVLEKEGFTTKLVDAIVENVDFAALEKILRAFKPDLVVVNTASGSIESDLSVTRLAKKINSEVQIAAFGIHVSALPDDSFTLEPKLDFIIRGEPEETALVLAKTLRIKGNLAKVMGISWKKEGKTVHNLVRSSIVNLDSLPFPAWEKIKIRNYRMPLSEEPFLLVGTGRGCPYHCLFCADKIYYGQKLRLPTPLRVVDEIEDDQQKFKVNSFLFWAESFTLNKKFALGVCREILRRKLKIRFVINSRVDHFDRELAEKLKKAGCWQVGFGVESADDRILQVMRKGTTVAQIEKAVRITKDSDLVVTGHFMLGFPGETKETILKTIKLACDLPFDFAQFYCCVPFPGSTLYEIAKKEEWLRGVGWSYFEQNFSVLNLPSLSAGEVMELRRLAYRRFYLRPKIIFGTLGKIRSVTYLIKALAGFGHWSA